jgi:hypothetical protein
MRQQEDYQREPVPLVSNKTRRHNSMPYTAAVVPVMIASPGDVSQYRGLTRDALHEWNYIHSSASSVVLMPVGWETHSSPELGSRAQELINDQVLEDCDLLIGIFWTRLGTPTGQAASGTVEEIQRHVQAGKPAMIYFCEAPADLRTVDLSQYQSLQEFRGWCQQQGLIEIFLNADDFATKLRRQLQIALQKNAYLRKAFEQASSARDKVGTPGAIQSQPPDEYVTLAATLSPESRDLLVAAASDKSGVILAVDVLAGRIIQAGSKEFGQMDDRRSMAKWDYALQELLNLGLIERTGQGGKGDKIYQLGQRGYEVVQRLTK